MTRRGEEGGRRGCERSEGIYAHRVLGQRPRTSWEFSNVIVTVKPETAKLGSGVRFHGVQDIGPGPAPTLRQCHFTGPSENVFSPGRLTKAQPVAGLGGEAHSGGVEESPTWRSRIESHCNRALSLWGSLKILSTEASLDTNSKPVDPRDADTPGGGRGAFPDRTRKKRMSVRRWSHWWVLSTTSCFRYVDPNWSVVRFVAVASPQISEIIWSGDYPIPVPAKTSITKDARTGRKGLRPAARGRSG